MTGAGHELDGGDATGAGFIDGRVMDVDGIDDTDFGLSYCLRRLDQCGSGCRSSRG